MNVPHCNEPFDSVQVMGLCDPCGWTSLIEMQSIFMGDELKFNLMMYSSISPFLVSNGRACLVPAFTRDPPG